MKKMFIPSLLLVFIGVMALSCGKEETSAKPAEDAKFDDSPYLLQIGGLMPPQIAADNQLTIEGVKLGRMLFYEKRLSGDGSQSCASCHRQEHAFSDTTRLSIGIQGKEGKRQAMAIFNMAWHSNEFFWDGRAHLLRDQSLLPIQDPLEMDESLGNVVAKLSTDQKYKDQFVRAFGSNEITPERISLALEQFMNSIVSANSKYDKYLNGQVALSAEEERGRELFFAEFNPGFPDISGADCAHCHTGKTLENDLYMNNGLDFEADIIDIGREEVTNNAQDRGKFKVPSLRNIEVTPPYMHDGRFETLEQVVDHYNSGIHPSSTVDPALEYTRVSGGLSLSGQDKADLVAFLKTFTDQEFLTNPEYSSPFSE